MLATEAVVLSLAAQTANPLPGVEEVHLGLMPTMIIATVTAVYGVVGWRWRWWAPSNGTSVDCAPWLPAHQRLLVALVALAAILRLLGLESGLWADEISTLINYVRPRLATIVVTYDSSNQHMLYSVLSHVAITLGGEHAWTLRLPAALFGIGSVWALVRFARTVAPPGEALLAGLVLAVTPQHVWFSQNARGYSGVLFFTLVTSWLFVEAYQRKDGRRWLAYALCVGLGMYTHLTMILPVLGHASYVVIERARQGKNCPLWQPFMAGFIPSALITLLLYGPVLPQLLGGTTSDVSDVATWRSLGWLVEEFTRELAAGGSAAVLLAGGLVVLTGTIGYLRTAWLVPWLLWGGAGLGTTLMLALQHHLWPRFFLFAAGFGVLVAVRGLLVLAAFPARVWPSWERYARPLGTTLVIFAAILLSRGLPYVYGPKQDFGGAYELVKADARDGDATTAVGVAASAFHMYYDLNWSNVASIHDLETLEDQHDTVWLVHTLPIQLADNYPELWQRLQDHYELVQVFPGTLHDGDVFVYRRAQTKPHLRSGDA